MKSNHELSKLPQLKGAHACFHKIRSGNLHPLEKFNVDASCVCRNILGDQVSCCVSCATKQSCKKGKPSIMKGQDCKASEVA